MNERQRRARNIVIFGVPESQAGNVEDETVGDRARDNYNSKYLKYDGFLQLSVLT